MANNLCNEPGKKSVRLNEEDVRRARELGLEDTSASTVFSRLLEMAQTLEQIRDRKREEHREKRERLRDEEELYGLE